MSSLIAIDFRLRHDYLRHRLAQQGRFLDAILKVERVRFPRAVSQTAPGRLRASCPPVLRPVRGVQPLDWDRQARVTPVHCRVPGNVSQATWPEVENPRPRNPGQSRGGAPRGERARSGRFGSSVARAAPEARAGGDICSCGAAHSICAFRRSASLYLFGGETSVAFILAAKLGCEARRENGIARTFRPR